MNTIRNIFQAIKTTLKFLWRHCLTITFSVFITSIFIHGAVNWKNALITLCIVIAFDWIKMKWAQRPTTSHFRSQASDLPLHMKSLNSPSVIGSPFYNLSNPSQHF